MTVRLHTQYGFTCGLRSDGSRCVLWSDDTFEWFSATEFAINFGV